MSNTNAGYSYTSGFPSRLPSILVPQIKTYVSTSDISLLSQSLTILALLLELSPTKTFPEVERDLLPNIYSIAHSPLVSGAALDSMLAFFGALVQADRQIAAHVVPNLFISIEREGKGGSPANVARCVAQVVKSQQDIAAGTIAEFSKHLKVPDGSWPLFWMLTVQLTIDRVQSSDVQRCFESLDPRRTRPVHVSNHPCLSTLCFLIIDDSSDMYHQKYTFTDAIDHFDAEQEEIRAAAAFAAGWSSWLLGGSKLSHYYYD